MSVVIETTIGDITVDLYLKERPNACLNFLKLCRIKYYNLCIFYKVEPNFIAQTGDPTATGRGGESIFSHLYGEQAKYFDCEVKPRLKHEKLGTLSMVNNGNNMNGSQFFLTLGENLTYLDEVHTVFGEVVEGFEVLVKLNEAICDPSNRPYQDIRITHTVILHDPYDDPAGLQIPDASPIPTKEQLDSGYIGADEEIDDTKGKNAEEIEEKIKDSEAKARATILEMVGDLPDADVKPPENVLFVCKLNPVTTSEDLEIIFSRFGKIESCEVIKDRKSGESLQYAFIEFEQEEDCENAYFKMDNVLIDDRRIHVDFSQSVSKMNWEKEANHKLKKLSKGQNFVIKGAQKSDGYGMVFDMGTSAGNKQSSVPYDSSKRSKANPYDSNKRSQYSNERHRKDRYIEEDSRYTSKKSDYNSSSVRSKNSRSRDTEARHRVSRSPYRNAPPRRLDQKSRYSGHSVSTEKASSSKISKMVKKHGQHDSFSDGSVSPSPNKFIPVPSYKKNKHSLKKEDSKSNTTHHKNLRQASPSMRHKKQKRRDSSSTSSSTSSSSESLSPVRKSSKKVHQSSSHYRSPESANYKKRNTKPYSQSPELSYQSNKSSSHKLTRLNSRSNSPEKPRKTSSKHKSSRRRQSSSPEYVRKQPEYSKPKQSEVRGIYEKQTKLNKSSKNYSKYSDDSSDSDAKQYKSKVPKSSSKHQHTSRNVNLHKHRRRSSS